MRADGEIESPTQLLDTADVVRVVMGQPDGCETSVRVRLQGLQGLGEPFDLHFVG